MNAPVREYEVARGTEPHGARRTGESRALPRIPPHWEETAPTTRLIEEGGAAQGSNARVAVLGSERFLHKSLGHWNPIGCLVAVIDDPDGAASAALALRAAGFRNEHIRVIPAAEMLAHFGGARGSSLLAQIAYFVADWSDYASFTAEYVEEAHRGHYVVMVYAPALDQANHAHAALERFGAHLARHYEPWLVRSLSH